MSEPFHVGQEVVCVDDRPRHLERNDIDHTIEVQKGQRYVVRWVGMFQHPRADLGTKMSVRVEGIVRSPAWGDVPFNANRFSPIKPDAIEWAREMCRKATAIKRLATPRDLD